MTKVPSLYKITIPIPIKRPHMIPLLFSIASITHLLVLYFVPDEVVFKLGSKILPILILIFLYFFRGNWKDKAGRFIFAGLIFFFVRGFFFSSSRKLFRVRAWVLSYGSDFIFYWILNRKSGTSCPIHSVLCIWNFLLRLDFFRDRGFSLRSGGGLYRRDLYNGLESSV